MCQYSLEGFKTKDAKEGDTVYSTYDHQGAFTSSPGRSIHDSPREGLTCVLYGQVCTLENVQFRPGVRAPHAVALTGTRQVVKLAKDSSGRYGDQFVFENGYTIGSAYVVSPIYIGLKAEVHEAGMKAVEAGIKEGIATAVPAEEKRVVDAL